MAERQEENSVGEDQGNLWDTHLNPDWVKKNVREQVQAMRGNHKTLLPGGQQAQRFVSAENSIDDLSKGGTIWQANFDGTTVEYRVLGGII